MGALWVILALVAFIIVYAIVLYNRLVTLRNRVDNAWSQVDVQLKRRHDLVPNLVETVKGYAAHESKTLEAVVAARNAAVAVAPGAGIAEQAQAENALTGALGKLFALAESYPELKANTNFLDLQQSLTETENKIGYARQFFNDTVMTYNTAIQVFPATLLAGSFGFTARTYFEIEDAQAEPVAVKF